MMNDLSLAAFKSLSLLFCSLTYNVSQCGSPCSDLESFQIKDHNNGAELNDYNLMVIIMITNHPSVKHN